MLQVNFVGIVDFAAGQLEFDATLFDSHVLELHAHRRHGGARVLEGERESAADGRRLPSRLHAAADESAGARAPRRSCCSRAIPTCAPKAYFAVTSNYRPVRRAPRALLRLQRLQRRTGFPRLDVLIHRHTVPLHRRHRGDARRAHRQPRAVPVQPAADARRTDALARARNRVVRDRLHLHDHHRRATSTSPSATGCRAARAGRCARALVDAHHQSRRTGIPRLPPASNQTVTLRARPMAAQGPLVLHPFGRSRSRRRSRRSASRSSASAPPCRTRAACSASSTSSSAWTDAPTTPVRERSSRRRSSSTMSDAEALSRPSFDDFDSRRRHRRRRAAVAADWMRMRDVAYEVIYLPEHHPVRVRFGMPDVARRVLRSRAPRSRRSPLSRAQGAPSPLADRGRWARSATRRLVRRSDAARARPRVRQRHRGGPGAAQARAQRSRARRRMRSSSCRRHLLVMER